MSFKYRVKISTYFSIYVSSKVLLYDMNISDLCKGLIEFSKQLIAFNFYFILTYYLANKVIGYSELPSSYVQYSALLWHS